VHPQKKEDDESSGLMPELEEWIRTMKGCFARDDDIPLIILVCFGL
jgi:hypothetical protein